MQCDEETFLMTLLQCFTLSLVSHAYTLLSCLCSGSIVAVSLQCTAKEDKLKEEFRAYSYSCHSIELKYYNRHNAHVHNMLIMIKKETILFAV